MGIIEQITDTRQVNLKRTLNPRSIALIGATARRGSFSARTIANLDGYEGELFLVNARYEQVGDRPCYPSLSHLPHRVDAAIIAVPADLVEDALVQCVNAGVGGAVIYASGYAEMGDEISKARQQRLADIAQAGDVRLLGPNCMGVVNYSCGAVQSFQQFPATSPNNSRAIGLISQSGALALALSQAKERGVSFSHILTFGNGAEVDVGDFVEYLVHEPECKAIACLFEGLAQPEKLLQAAALAWQHDKPLVVCKLATGDAGAKAALSHTGTLAGSHAQYRAMLESHGAIVVDRFEALLELASFFAKAPRKSTPGVGIVAASGGAGIMAVDKAELYGVALPQPNEDTREQLKANIPVFGSPNNPCDVTAEVVNRPESLNACMQAMAADPAFGALVVPHTVAGDLFTPRLAIYSQTSQQFQKPVCAVWLSAWSNGPGSVSFEADPYVSVFTSMDNCFFALQRWQWRSSLERVVQVLEATDARLRSRVADTLSQHPPGSILTERMSKELLASYGVPVNREIVVTCVHEAVRAASSIGFPVALKALSSDIPHKTEAGVVALGIADEQALEQAFEAIQRKIDAMPIAPRLEGFLVQEMVSKGVEIIVGASVDPHFGPVVVVGHGGIFVELIADSVAAPAPITVRQAGRMVAALKGQKLFDGFRGSAPINRDALAHAISQISQFVADHATSISEVDVNPLICIGERVVAVDSLIVRK